MKELGSILEAVGNALAGSLASRTRCNAGAKRLIAPPPPGTPLLVSLALALEHTGIYLGKNKVARTTLATLLRKASCRSVDIRLEGKI